MVSVTKMKVEPSVHERILRAFLDRVILKMLQRHPSTGYEINDSISKRFGIKIGPNVVYTKLSSMERDGLITCLQHGRTRTHDLTEKGKETLEDVPQMIKEIQRSAMILLGG